MSAKPPLFFAFIVMLSNALTTATVFAQLSCPVAKNSLAPSRGSSSCRLAQSQAEIKDCQQTLLREREAFARSAAVTGGFAGTLYHVTTLKDSVNPEKGSLRYGLLQVEPSWIVFDVEGTIRLVKKIKPTSHKTIDGRGSRITIEGFGISLDHVSNVIISDIKIQNTDNDQVGMGGPQVSRVWLHHLWLEKGSDELIGITKGATDITISWSVLTGQSLKTMLIAGGIGSQGVKGRVALHHLYWKGGGSRLPKVGSYWIHIYNNFYEDTDGSRDVTCYGGCQLQFEANFYLPKKFGHAVVDNDLGSNGHTEGFIKSLSNKISNWGYVRQNKPGQVTDPSSLYFYKAEKATKEMACRIKLQAGPRF